MKLPGWHRANHLFSASPNSQGYCEGKGIKALEGAWGICYGIGKIRYKINTFWHKHRGTGFNVGFRGGWCDYIIYVIPELRDCHIPPGKCFTRCLPSHIEKFHVDAVRSCTNKMHGMRLIVQILTTQLFQHGLESVNKASVNPIKRFKWCICLTSPLLIAWIWSLFQIKFLSGIASLPHPVLECKLTWGCIFPHVHLHQLPYRPNKRKQEEADSW